MLSRMGLLLRLGPNVIADGTFITLGSSYYTCAFYKPTILLEDLEISLFNIFPPLDSTQYNSIPRCVDWSPLDHNVLAIGRC